MKNLIYFVVGCAPDYVRLLEFCVATICMTTQLHDIDILVICDQDYVRHVKKVLPWVKIHLSGKNSTPMISSIRKVEIFDYPNINHYKKILYLDCDIIVIGDISAIFAKTFTSDVLYVKTESYDINAHQDDFNTYKRYSKAKLQKFKDRDQFCFNCGQFAFLNCPENKEHFRNVRALIIANSERLLYEQPFMNYYFNTHFKTDSKLLDNFCALFRACADNNAPIPMTDINDEWGNRGEIVVHFINCTQPYLEKLSNMILFFSHLYARKQHIATVHSRCDIANAITLPPTPIIAEVGGVFKGDFARVLLDGFKPQMLYLVDPYIGDITSGDQDGINVETCTGDLLYKNLSLRFQNARNVNILRTESCGLNMFPDDAFDLVYFDATKSYESVKNNLDLLYTKTKHGGWICGRGLMLNPEKAGKSGDFAGKLAIADMCRDKGQAVHTIFMDGVVGFAIEIFKVKSFRHARPS